MNAYILAGGRSTRMGTSKASLFLDRVAAAARGAFDDVVAVHRPDGEPLSIRTIFEEPHEHEAAIFGVERALRDARAACFILAVDYAFITTDVLEFLRDRGGVPMWNGQPQPLCAVWNPDVLELVERRIAQGAFDLRGLIAESRAAIIPEAELRARFPGEPLMNVNTPEDLRDAEREHGR